MNYYKFRILTTGEIAFVMAKDRDSAQDKLLRYFDSPDEFCLFRRVDEEETLGYDVY